MSVNLVSNLLRTVKRTQSVDIYGTVNEGSNSTISDLPEQLKSVASSKALGSLISSKKSKPKSFAIKTKKK